MGSSVVTSVMLVIKMAKTVTTIFKLSTSHFVASVRHQGDRRTDEQYSSPTSIGNSLWRVLYWLFQNMRKSRWYLLNIIFNHFKNVQKSYSIKFKVFLFQISYSFYWWCNADVFCVLTFKFSYNQFECNERKMMSIEKWKRVW